MKNRNSLQPAAEIDEASLDKLARSISISRGEFALFLACCNSPPSREIVAKQLGERVSGKICNLQMRPSFKKLYSNLPKKLSDRHPEAVMVFGLESVRDIDSLLAATNFARNEFAKCLSCPLVLWVNDDIMKKLIRVAPDFKNWAAATIRFADKNNHNSI